MDLTTVEESRRPIPFFMGDKQGARQLPKIQLCDTDKAIFNELIGLKMDVIHSTGKATIGATKSFNGDHKLNLSSIIDNENDPQPEGIKKKNQDSLVFELLELLSEYETLANDSFRVNFINGFLDLSRANYHGSWRFSAEFVDMRPRKASAVVEIRHGNINLIDHWKTYKQLVDSESAPKKNGVSDVIHRNIRESISENLQLNISLFDSFLQRTDATEMTEDMEKHAAVSSARKCKGSLRNRNRNKDRNGNENRIKQRDLENVEDDCLTRNISHSNAEDDLGEVPRDPLYQFGVLVPLQLKSAQGHFMEALLDSIKLLHLQKKILQLVTKIQES